jgi:hypothetical protein
MEGWLALPFFIFKEENTIITIPRYFFNHKYHTKSFNNAFTRIDR